MSIKLNSQSNYTSFFHTPEAVFISTDCLWRSLSQYVRFPFTEPGLCTNTGVLFFFFVFLAQTLNTNNLLNLTKTVWDYI